MRVRARRVSDLEGRRKESRLDTLLRACPDSGLNARLGWARDDGGMRESLAGPRSGAEDTGAQVSPQPKPHINR